MNEKFYEINSLNLKDKKYGLTPNDYYELLSTIWSKKTCAPRMQNEWNKNNITLGQCSITAFLMQDIFGGDVYGIPLPDGNFHCFNVINDSIFDLTSAQFKNVKLDYKKAILQKRENHFKKEEKKNRYLYLKNELLKKLK